VRGPSLELERGEALALCDALLGPGRAPGTLALVRDGRVLAVVDAELGPARRPASAPLALGARAAAGARVRVLDPAAPLGEAVPELAASCAALPATRAVLAAAARVRLPSAWLVEDGAYGLGIREDRDGPAALICARVRGGRLERLAGGAALGVADVPRDAASLAELLLRRIGRPVALVLGTRSALRAIASSTRPASALERARIRRTVDVATPSRRAALALVGMRLLGL
jgi:hypothetical protein